jgi:hypothetical protein
VEKTRPKRPGLEQRTQADSRCIVVEQISAVGFPSSENVPREIGSAARHDGIRGTSPVIVVPANPDCIPHPDMRKSCLCARNEIL